VGPVVTAIFSAQGSDPRTTIGTVNTTEFLPTLSISIAFIATLGFAAFTLATVGLIIGGVPAAPLGALMVKRIKPRGLVAKARAA